MVLDNVDDPQILNPYWSDMLSSGSLLITSKENIPRLAALVDASDSALLEPFSETEGTSMIKRRLGTKGQEQQLDDQLAASLARRFGFYPLYMDQMASYIESDPVPLSEWQRRLDEEFGKNELQDVDPEGPWYRISVAKAMETHVMKLDAPNRLVLATIGFFDPDNIPEKLLLSRNGGIENLETPFKRHKTLQRLSKPSLVQVQPSPHDGAITGGQEHGRWISLHRLVRDSAIRSCPDLQKAFDNAIHLLRQAFPLHKPSRDHMVEDWDDCETFQPHVLALHRRYTELRDQRAMIPSFNFIELIYSCAWYVLYHTHP